MRQATDKHRIGLGHLVCVLLVLVLLSARVVSGTYARFAVKGAAADSARVAAFVFVTRDKDSTKRFELSEIQKPGDEQTYSFTVSNQNEASVSEVAQQVTLTVQLNGSMPLVCTICKGNAEFLRAEITETTQSLPVTKSTELETFPASEPRTDTYTLKVQWPKEANDSKYASRSAVAEVVLTAVAEQVD